MENKIKNKLQDIDGEIEKLYQYVCEKVRELQESTGKDYVMVTRGNGMCFYAYESPYDNNIMYEGDVAALRVALREGLVDLQIIGTVTNVVFDDESIPDASLQSEEDGFDAEWENHWQYIKGNDSIRFQETLLSIAWAIGYEG